MKGRVVALQQSCVRENELRNVRKRVGTISICEKTWKTSHFDFSSLSDGQFFLTLFFNSKNISALLNIKEKVSISTAHHYALTRY